MTTRVPTLLQNIPGGVTVIDRATIGSRGYTTLSEALSAAPGLRVVQSGGQGGSASVFIRGTDSADVLVLRNGVPINDPSDLNGAFSFGVDRLEDIERIEVVHGLTSSLYGSGAISGVVNLITRTGADAAHGSVVAAGELPLQNLFAAALSGQVRIIRLHLDAENRSQQGSDITPRRESVYDGALNGYRTSLGSLELGCTPVDGTRFSVLVRGTPACSGSTNRASPPTTRTITRVGDNSAFGRLGATTILLGGAWESGLFLSRGICDRDYNEAFGGGGSEPGRRGQPLSRRY